jgi:hypothetical protein
MITRKNVELNNIFNLANFHDLNFPIIQIELQWMQKQCEILAIYLFLFTNLVSWDHIT